MIAANIFGSGSGTRSAEPVLNIWIWILLRHVCFMFGKNNIFFIWHFLRKLTKLYFRQFFYNKKIRIIGGLFVVKGSGSVTPGMKEHTLMEVQREKGMVMSTRMRERRVRRRAQIPGFSPSAEMELTYITSHFFVRLWHYFVSLFQKEHGKCLTSDPILMILHRVH